MEISNRMDNKSRLSNMQRFFLVVVFVLLGFFLDLDLVRSPSVANAQEKVKAPEITVSSLDGGSVTLKSYRGKWVFLNFWATWCTPCVEEMPSLNDFHNKFKDRNIEVVAISIDSTLSLVKEFVKKHGLEFSVMHDPSKKSFRAFGGKVLPTTIVIDPEGYIAAFATGPRDWNDPVIRKFFLNLMFKQHKEI